ncbi:6-phospho-beta-glucosidase [Entomoplasma freundtii]|uniref:6-phospho-beta-glucosidase n=1 Tax=Entomoplasma freundtii TaxID=74700 RepID=A0A2K8NSW6_9MOLU|nr:glycoside hydrolase family 1 protein [Entomoplasma freundtii]ATZ16258.1 6-phospho-beta-glucosidase [Entomoplasma freundtii]TDY56841.1 6-phospho-beta-glucosidase [Entomoplasma freundtii]
MLKFPKNFEFGASISALQTEGHGCTKTGLNTFDAFFDKSPELFFNQVGPQLTCDITTYYKEDIAMFKTIGFDSLRTGFAWARLFPDGETLNEEAVIFYHDYIREYKKNHIKLYMTLFHFDMPLWAYQEGGWSSRKVINKFVKYAEFVFKEFHDEVDCFVTFNEPLVPVFEGYLGKRHYPGIWNPQEAIKQAYGIFLAHSKVIKLYRKLKLKKPIGVVYNWNYTYPLSNKPQDLKAAQLHDAYVNRGPLDIMFNGKISSLLIESLKEYNLLPPYSTEEIAIIKDTKIDFLGINYYFPTRVRQVDNIKSARWGLEEVVAEIPKTANVNPFRGWEIYPEALYDIGMTIKNEFHNIPWYIAENGIGVENEESYRDQSGLIQDDYRIKFLTNHLQIIKEVMNQGSNCFGYHMWAALDCWSFRNAFKNRYGFIEVDLTDMSRRFKKSAFWYQELIKNKEVHDENTH